MHFLLRGPLVTLSKKAVSHNYWVFVTTVKVYLLADLCWENDVSRNQGVCHVIQKSLKSPLGKV